MSLRLSEHFVSPQGEGPRTGVLTQFVRFAGCNMRCAGWPCDTPYAIDPSIWRTDSYKRTPEELVEECVKHRIETGATQINLTGGEPFQQDHVLLKQFVEALHRNSFMDIECFSNGSFIYPDWALREIDFIMDWKLPGSGEADTRLENRLQNAKSLKPMDAIKFVVCDDVDLMQAKTIWEDVLRDQSLAGIWCGPAWGRIEAAEIVEFIKRHRLPWRLNVQVHNYVYEAQARGR